MMSILLAAITIVVVIPVACCAVNATPEDRARDDAGYMEWLKEYRKKKEVRQ